MKIKIRELAAINNSLMMLSQYSLPCSWAITKNINYLKPIIEEQYTGKLEAVRDQFCLLQENGKSSYRVLPHVNGKGPLRFEDFDAGDKQEEYRKALDKVTQKEIDVAFHTINVNRKVHHNGDGAVPLWEKIDACNVPAVLLTNLQDRIFVEE